jgi:hypothetical protein
VEILHELNLRSAVDQFLTARPYYPCCLLVHRDVKHLEQASIYLASRYQWPVLSVGTVVSEALLHSPPDRRPSEAHRIVKNAVQQRLPGPVLCTDIDILFEPTLRLDPLRLLRDTSRIAPVIVTWPGSFINGILAYATAVPPHAHYRDWPRPELCEYCIIPL